MLFLPEVSDTHGSVEASISWVGEPAKEWQIHMTEMDQQAYQTISFSYNGQLYTEKGIMVWVSGHVCAKWFTRYAFILCGGSPASILKIKHMLSWWAAGDDYVSG